MTSKNLYSRIKSAVFVSALFTASMQFSLTAYASATPVEPSVDAIDTITYFSQELPTVDSAPDVPFTTEQISQLPDATVQREDYSRCAVGSQLARIIPKLPRPRPGLNHCEIKAAQVG